MKKITLLSLLFMLLSCTEKSIGRKDQNTKTVKHSSSMEMDSIDFTLDSFVKIPDEIDGCGCYFYLSTEDEQSRRFIFVNDFANVAFVSINRNIEKFELKKHDEKSNLYWYSNGVFDLKVAITKKTTKEYETTYMEGEISLSKGSRTVSKFFTGTCGC